MIAKQRGELALHFDGEAKDWRAAKYTLGSLLYEIKKHVEGVPDQGTRWTRIHDYIEKLRRLRDQGTFGATMTVVESDIDEVDGPETDAARVRACGALAGMRAVRQRGRWRFDDGVGLLHESFATDADALEWLRRVDEVAIPFVTEMTHAESTNGDMHYKVYVGPYWAVRIAIRLEQELDYHERHQDTACYEVCRKEMEEFKSRERFAFNTSCACTPESIAWHVRSMNMPLSRDLCIRRRMQNERCP